MADYTEKLGSELLSNELGKFSTVPTSSLQGKTVCLYFSAHWVGCRFGCSLAASRLDPMQCTLGSLPHTAVPAMQSLHARVAQVLQCHEGQEPATGNCLCVFGQLCR
jgi:hypothetical protein